MCLFLQPSLKFHQLKTMAIRLLRNKSPRISCGSILDYVCVQCVYMYIDTMTIILYSTYTMLVLNPHLIVSHHPLVNNSREKHGDPWLTKLITISSARKNHRRSLRIPGPSFHPCSCFPAKAYVAGRCFLRLQKGDKISGGTINPNKSFIHMAILSLRL